MASGMLHRPGGLSGRLRAATPPGREPIVLSYRRVYILPTRLGFLYAATVVILLVGSINYALALGYALTFMLAGLGLAAMVHTARNLARIALSVGRVDAVFSGEPAQFRLFLDGRAGFDRPAILVRHGEGSQFVVDIPARGIAEVVLDVPTRRRGWMGIGRVRLETRFPLGLFRAWSTLEPDARCLVYPRPQRSPLPRPSAESAAGALRSQATGNDDFSGLRSYQPSDSLRHIAWKAVARSDHMLTKQFTGQAAAELWLDWNQMPQHLSLEDRLSRLAGWVLGAEREGVQYGLRLPEREIAPGRGDVHVATCLQALALFPTS